MSVHTTGASETEWNDMFEKMVQCKQQHGNILCNPQRFSRIIGEEQEGVEDHKSLFCMSVDAQKKRKHHKLGLDEVLDDRYHRLASWGGFETTNKKGISRGHDERWNDMYEKLISFKQKYGHMQVPQQYNENPKLGFWVMRWRSNYREYKRTNGQKGDPERMKHLERIGLVDDISTGYENVRLAKCRWDDILKPLLEFKQKHGHLRVPRDSNENRQLARWMGYLRYKYREYRKTDGQKGDPERMKHLESIGLVDNISRTGHGCGYNPNWDGMFNLMLEFKQKHGHCKVPREYDENPKLGRWVSQWRYRYREYKRTSGQKGDPKRMKRLESIGLVDDITTGYENMRAKCTRWDDILKLLLEFKQKHGHLRVPRKYNENPKLGRWASQWRYKYREYKRTNGQKGDPERMKHLESIGLVDDIIFRKHENRKTRNHVDNEVFAPIIVSSMSPSCLSNNQNFTEETPSSIRMKGGKNGNSGGADTQATLDSLGSELRDKGGFWA